MGVYIYNFTCFTCMHLHVLLVCIGSMLTVNKDVVYAVFWTESCEWCRTLVINGPDSKSNVHVKYPDYGNEDCVQVSQLRVLPHKFYSLPL